MPLQNTQYDTLMREYDRRRMAHRHTLEEHQTEVYDRIPRIREIEDEISSLSLNTIRARLGALDGTSLPNFRTRMDELKAEREKLLVESGYGKDYLTLQYDCPLCQDTGYIDGEKCQCLRKAAVDLLYTQSNLKEILEKENFDSFSFNYYSDTIVNGATGLTAHQTAVQAVDVAKEFIATFGSDFRNLFFYGNTGVGKTFLSHCIAKELMDQGNGVIYFSAFDLFETLSQSTFRKSWQDTNTNEDILGCDLLIIDDLGTELTNSFVSSALFQCINERILRKKPTIISTNLSLDGLRSTYSDRVFSRITSHYTMVQLIGDDIRIQKRLLGGKQ